MGRLISNDSNIELDEVIDEAAVVFTNFFLYFAAKMNKQMSSYRFERTETIIFAKNCPLLLKSLDPSLNVFYIT